MDLLVNGRAKNGYYRLDNLDENRIGMDFLINPFAMVRTLEDAEFIVRAVEFYEKQLEKDKTESMDQHWNSKNIC